MTMFVIVCGCGTASDPSDSDADFEDDREAEGSKWSPPSTTYWDRVFTDNFEGAALDTSKWFNARAGVAWNSCVEVRDSKLIVPPAARLACRITTIKHFGEGADKNKPYVFAASVKLPRTKGHFPSFWVNSIGVDPESSETNLNEIDIIEAFGPANSPNNECGDPKNVTSNDGKGWYGIQNVFYSQYENDAGRPRKGHVHCFGKNQVDTLKPFDGKFHVYSATWVPGQYVRYSMDGKTTAQFGSAYASNQAVTAILTNILTGDNTKDDITGEGPRNMEVAWVRVWRKK